MFRGICWSITRTFALDAKRKALEKLDAPIVAVAQQSEADQTIN